ncbi:hypothetical protein FGO68_gene8626 [Halteria grandinella]|uniref:Uncharacterized protein n=1 Tax=Halteria grandinella TaxID=5974 RepID=A0A8J8T2M6_HALGN|nr:hypothetical protein FGO68_gene8626 [Halteria grandinella]
MMLRSRDHIIKQHLSSGKEMILADSLHAEVSLKTVFHRTLDQISSRRTSCLSCHIDHHLLMKQSIKGKMLLPLLQSGFRGVAPNEFLH